MLFDRLYGKITFPKIIRSLLTCPGLLRLREVRLANVPFLAFPSFSTCTRYEHSIGVCHLAKLAAKTLALTEREKIELMIACLYHDVATPPFAHTMEEVFRKKYGFDHEKHLYNLITGKTNDLGREKAQVFQGRGLKLRSVSQKSEMRKLGLDLFEIADFAIGKGKLGSLVNSTVDLDNIDNIIRATSALGIHRADAKLAEELAGSFVLSDDTILLSEKSLRILEIWQKLRYRLYSLIYRDIKDFSLETMISHAARILVASKNEEERLRKEDWCLTEQEMIHNRFMNNPITKKIVQRMRNADTYACLAVLSVLTHNLDQIINTFIPNLEEHSREFFKLKVIGNYFIDKRSRTRKVLREHYPLTSFTSKEKTIKTRESIPRLIIGLFTPEKATSVGEMEKISEFKEIVFSLLPSGNRVRFHLFGNRKMSQV